MRHSGKAGGKPDAISALLPRVHAHGAAGAPYARYGAPLDSKGSRSYYLM